MKSSSPGSGERGTDARSGPGIVESKLRAPRLRPGALRRSRLLERLDTAADHHVLVRAPAGYGKTTLVRHWVASQARPWAWLTLDRTDGDPISLLRHVVAALASVAPIERAWTAACVATPDPMTVLAALAAELSDAAAGVVLVLDDVHEVDDPAAIELLDQLLDVVAEPSVVVLASRADPGPRRTRRLLDGTITELGAEELRFDPDESAHLLRVACPDLSDEQLEHAVDRCDGWAAGIALLALALDGADDPSRVTLALSDADVPVAEYLRDEVLTRLSDDERAFFARTAVLDTLSAGLCDAVLDTSGSHAVLERMASSGNLFVAGLDDGGMWYRYHHLWRQLLLVDLRATRPDEEAMLRRRAATWLESHGRDDEALQQWFAAGDPQRAAEVVGRALSAYATGGRVRTLERWIDRFTVDEVLSDPALVLTSAWITVMTSAADDARHRLQQLAAFPPDTVLPDGTTVGLGRAAVAMVAGLEGTKDVIVTSDVLVDAGPVGNPWFGAARLVGTVARTQVGALDDPAAALAAVASETTGSPSIHAIAVAQQALVLLPRDPDAAHTLAVQATRELEAAGLDDYVLGLPVHAIAALDAARRGDRTAFDAAVQRADRLLPRSRGASRRAALQVNLVLGEAHIRAGDVTRAREHLRIAQGLLPHEPDALVFVDAADDLAARIDATTDGPVDALSTAERRVLELLPTHLTLQEISETLFVSRNTVKTQTIAIYRKFGVSSRGDAVDVARRLGLLEP